MMRLTVALAIMSALFGVEVFSAPDPSSARFEMIRVYAKDVDKKTFEALLENHMTFVRESVKLSKTMRDNDKKVLDEIMAKFAMNDSPIKFVTFSPLGRPGGFLGNAGRVDDTVFVSESFIDDTLKLPNGRGMLEATVAHELSHGSRDFLILRVLSIDKVLNGSEKDRWRLQLELNADLGAIEMLRTAGLEPQFLIQALKGFGETERVSSAEKTLKTLRETDQRQQR